MLMWMQVETIGDAYMVVAGAPEVVIDHAQKICSMALDMVDTIVHLKDSSTGTSHGFLPYNRIHVFKG